jgi:hypothetical protein
MSSSRPITTPESGADRDRARRLGLYGLLAHWEEVEGQPWLPWLLAIEDTERSRRSLERRIHNARIGAFKPMADFDWSWPKKIHRATIDELFTLQFIEEGANVVLLGPNGVGKSMIAKNLAYQAVLRGYTARFTPASDMLNDLAAQQTSGSLARRLRRYCNPMLLCVDEVGYLSYDNNIAERLVKIPATGRKNYLFVGSPRGGDPSTDPSDGQGHRLGVPADSRQTEETPFQGAPLPRSAGASSKPLRSPAHPFRSMTSGNPVGTSVRGLRHVEILTRRRLLALKRAPTVKVLPPLL